MKKSLEKMRVRIDQNLNRSEKTVALPIELEKIGMYVEFCNFFSLKNQKTKFPAPVVLITLF